MRQRDFWVGLVMAIGAAAVLFFIVPYQIPDRMVSGMSIAFFPKMLLIGIVAFSVVLMVQNLFWSRSAPRDESAQEPKVKSLQLDLILLATLPVCYVVARYLGVPALALLGTPAVMVVYGERRWWLIAIVAIGLAVFARLVMVDLLQRPPLGIW